MVAIHPTWCHANSRTQAPDGDASVDSSRSYSARTVTNARTRGWQKLLPQPDIPGCIALSKLRCFVTLVSFALLVTDIPRTGLGVRNLLEYYPVPFMPSTAVRFGPVDYPITHIWRVDNSTDDVNASETFVGLKGVQPMSAVRAWPYQHDTISVGLRGAVELLNVTEFPDFLLYKGQQATNPDTLIGLSTIFTMLDAFMTAARAELLREDNTYSTLRFATKHNWIDRLHHYVVRFASKNPAWRVHSLHVVSIPRKAQSLAICSNAGNTKRSSLRPRFCNHPGIWKCPHPLDPSLPAVRLWDHMDLRLQALKQRYPDLELDVVLLSSQRFSTTSGVMRSTYYNYEALEVALLTRGRRCVELETNSSSEPKVVTCTTVFVDDHRYERDTVQTNVIDWYGIISVLRGGAQAYVWVRLALLIYGASVAARQEAAGCPQSQPRSVCLSVVAIVFRIPFEVIVYSSLLPVTGYVVALLLDGSFADIFLDSYWTAVGGTINIGLVTFLRTTAVQMRNVWLLALVVTVVVFAVKKTRGHWSDGTPGIRGLVISFTSTLTICGPYKRTFYRDTNITNVFRLADESQIMDIIHCNPVGLFNASTYIFDDSAIMLLFCIVVVVGLVMVVKALGFLAPRRNWVRRETGGVVLNSTPIVPCGARRLWVASVLSIHFNVVPRPSLASHPTRHIGVVEPQAKVRPFHSSTPSIARDSRRNLLAGTQRPSTPFQSTLQLMNIAMMTDPWNFFWLRLIGVQLYLYRIRSAPVPSSDPNSSNNLASYAAILPYAKDEMEEYTGLNADDFRLLDSANSRDVPLAVLLQSG
ncbi:hypothetical protein PRIC1_005979 [Phytophthora ramorum]